MSSDVHALVGAYAVDALDDVERAEFEKHLATCESCRAEVASLTEAATQLAALTEVSPPPALRSKVLADIATVRPLAPRVAPPERRRSLRPRLIAVAAAAVVVVGAGAGVTAWHPWENTRAPVVLSAAQQIIHASDVQRTQTTLADGASLTVYRSPSLDRAVLVTADLPPTPASKVYELWLQDASGAMHPAGLMPRGSDATVVVRGRATGARGIGITVEPAGGSPAPTSTPVALIPFSAT